MINATRRTSWTSSSHYVGLDVSLETTPSASSTTGTVVWRGKCASDPGRDRRDRAHSTHRRRPGRLGDRTALELADAQPAPPRLPVVCLDARHAKAALSLQINKTDANDALGLAQIVRTGWYREVAVKSMDAHTLRMLLVARAQLVSQRQTIANTDPRAAQDFRPSVARGSRGLFRRPRPRADRRQPRAGRNRRTAARCLARHTEQVPSRSAILARARPIKRRSG